jgi:hypothetical protein
VAAPRLKRAVHGTLGVMRGAARWRRGLVAGSAVLALAGAARSAGAAPSDEPSSDALYAEARAALDAGNYDKACPLFAEYYEHDPVPGALFALAECESRWGKVARSLEHFEEFVRRTSDSPSTPVLEQRTRIANDHIRRLSEHVGRLTVAVSASIHGSVLVKLDGTPIAIPVPRPIVVEPGEHTLDLVSEDGARQQRRFIVGPGESRKIELGAAPTPVRPASEAPPSPSSSPSRWTLPVVVAGGTGLAGVLVGTGFGLAAWSTKSDIDSHCEGTLCDGQGKRAADRAQAFATVSTIGFTVGLAAIAAAAVIHFLDGGSR